MLHVFNNNKQQQMQRKPRENTQFPEMLSARGLAVNGLVFPHLACLSPERRVAVGSHRDPRERLPDNKTFFREQLGREMGRSEHRGVSAKDRKQNSRLLGLGGGVLRGGVLSRVKMGASQRGHSAATRRRGLWCLEANETLREEEREREGAGWRLPLPFVVTAGVLASPGRTPTRSHAHSPH